MRSLFLSKPFGSLGFRLSVLLCLGGILGEGFDFRSIEEKGMVFRKQVFVIFGGGRNVGSYYVALCNFKCFGISCFP